MPHCYASIAQLRDEITDGGSSVLTGNADVLRSKLEAASRRVEAYCDRSRYGSGFGPRIASNVYDSNGSSELDLFDDFLSFSAVSALAGTGGSSTSLTESTDYYPQPYSETQKRSLLIHGLTSVAFYSGLRTVTVAGVAGFSNVTAASTTTVASGLSTGTTATTFTTSATPTISPGQTLLIDTEQLYVTGLSGTTATVVRNANGTTAATHANSSAIAVYTYPDSVRDATIAIAMRRMKSRDAGLTGDFGGGQVPGSAHKDSEMSILYNTVGHLRIYYA